jgi:hypothetical protein
MEVVISKLVSKWNLDDKKMIKKYLDFETALFGVIERNARPLFANK